MQKEQRNQGIDLMRIVCMLMITTYHIIGHGGILIHPELSHKGYYLGRIMQALCFCAVDGYALISGYVGVNARYKYSSLAALWLQVWLYSAGLTALAAVLAPQVVNAQALAKGIAPTLMNQYWYFTAYAGCFLLVPLVRAALRHLSCRQAGVLLGVLLTGFCVLPAALGADPFATDMGYSCLWLLLVYALGAYIRKYDLFSRMSVSRLALVFAAGIVITCAAGFVNEHRVFQETGVKAGFGRLMRSDSPTMLACAAAMLLFFSRLRAAKASRLIAGLAPVSFGVYLIHDHPLVRQLVVNKYFSWIAAQRTVLLIPAIVLCALAVYALCSALDMLRAALFRKMRVAQRLNALENRLLGDLWNGI